MWIWPSNEFTDWKPSLSLYTKLVSRYFNICKCVFVLSSSLVAGYAPKEEALAAKQPHPPPHLLSGGNSWQRPRNLHHPQLHGLPGPTVWLWGECLQGPLTHNACEPTEIRTLVCSCQRKLAYLALIKVLFHLNPSRLIKRRVCRYIFAFVRTGKGKKVFFWCWSVKELSYSVPEVCAARNELCSRVWVCSVCSSGLAARSLRAPSVSVRALHWTADRIQASVRRKFPWTRNRSHEE